MKEKHFRISGADMKKLIEGRLGCIATDMIIVEGELVDYMYRENPRSPIDSGWLFLSGKEDQDYIDNPDNSAIYALNTIANYDPAIIPYIDYPIGSNLERIRGTDVFKLVNE